MSDIDCPRLFVLNRIVDETGVSGEGRVADGVIWTDGTVAMRWRTYTASVSFYDSIDDVITIHGHGGKTQIRYLAMNFTEEVEELLRRNTIAAGLAKVMDDVLNEDRT